MPKRRNQQDRTNETRAALIAATIEVIYREGYVGASTALIAEAANMSRGAILHQFGTRAELMAQVIRSIFDSEINDYDRQEAENGPPRNSDWVVRCWNVFSKPSGIVMVEVLLAARSDPGLAEKIGPMQSSIEKAALDRVLGSGPDTPETRARAVTMMRMIVWSVRGLVLGRLLTPNAESFEECPRLLQSLLTRPRPAA